MSENTIRHLIALFGTLTGLLVWWSGYASGARGWWWTVLGLIGLYWIIYSLVEA